MNKKIANILKGKLTGLAFVDQIAGLTYPLQMTEEVSDGDYKILRLPISCDYTYNQCITGKFTDLSPNDAFKSIIYFEDGGVSLMPGSSGVLKFQSRLKLVCWLNKDKLGKTDCDVTANVVINIIKRLTFRNTNESPYRGVSCVFVSQDLRDSNIFSKYTYSEEATQYLMHPYDFFALNFLINFETDPSCVEDFTIGTIQSCPNIES